MGALKIAELAPVIVYLHEQGVSIVDGVAELKGEHSICSTTFELCPQLGGSQSIVVESIVPANPLQSLYVPTNQPIATIKNHLRYKTRRLVIHL